VVAVPARISVACTPLYGSVSIALPRRANVLGATMTDPFGNVFGIIENPHFKLG
jgi:hypothetical protein